ncbi:hypothetical protein PSACC_02280 [Paramicrosporidium saccamoebae]|uniref:Uncharacterized protein n=1 Tax=Paramicrosporidium saccamoebae TaxID=1246581 RepID=A0A2H9TJQ4_9FUNG|nr:hypothetical protein PSACC_02280 [Paramicrosporidium saccamoebae]
MTSPPAGRSMLWPTLWIALLLGLVLRVSAVLYLVDEEGKRTVLNLDNAFDDCSVREWLHKMNLYLQPGRIDFAGATKSDLKQLPIKFFKDYATDEQLVQIWAMAGIHASRSEHIKAILRIAKTCAPEPNNPKAVNIRHAQLQPRRRQERSSSSPSTGSSPPSDSVTGGRHVQPLDTFLATGFSTSDDPSTTGDNVLIFDFLGTK